MTEPAEDVRYFEPGGSWWGLLFGPAFAAVGIGIELLTVGPVFWALWIIVAVGLFGFAALWVYGRRRFCLVRVTESTLFQGPERLPLGKIAEVSDDDDEPFGVRVLGGGMTVPRKYEPVPLRLTDGKQVVAWARDGDALRAALRGAAGA